MDFKIGEVFWDDDEPEAFGERLTFDDLKNVSIGECLLLDEDAENTPHGGTVVTLESLDDVSARFRGLNRMYVIGRRDMEEDCMEDDSGDFAMVWRLRTAENAEEMQKEPETVPMLTEKQQAEALHKQITGYGEVIYQSLYGMCTAIKQMRDSKLYKALGHSTFESYAQDMLGMTASQTYRYIKIADNLSADFVESTPQIGIQKLYLLAMAPEEARTEITQTVDLESTTVRELKAQIAALQNQNEDAEKSRADAEKRAQQWYDKAQEAEEAKERNRLTLRGIIDKKVELVHQLEAQIKELESRPQDVAVVDNAEELDRLKAEIESLRQQLAEKPDTQLPLGVSPIYQADSKALFKPYLAAAADAANRLAEFIGQHRDDENYSFFIEKMQAAFDFAKQRIQMMEVQ